MKIFVGCSSRDVGNEIYNGIADEIGEFIARNGHCLVFGGCSEGLMGRVYAKVNASNGNVIARQAKVYKDELIGLKADIEVFDTINQRKDGYTKIADVLVFIPGGIGTIDELISAIETRRSGEHKNPILIVNEDNFFGDLLNMLEKIYSEGLASEAVKGLYYVANSLNEAISALEVICARSK